MSRADAFDAFYHESRDRLLLQVYAFEGVTEVAQRALSDAYVSAAQQWRTVAATPDKDAWVRVRAFRATKRRSNRSHEPWFVTAQATADENRHLLGTLHSRPETERHLFVAVKLAGLDLPAAAREAGVPEAEAQATLDRALDALAGAGIDTSPDPLDSALAGLAGDLRHAPPDRSHRLRREGDRRRHSYRVLAGVCVVAVAVGATVVLTRGDDDAQNEGQTPNQTATGTSTGDTESTTQAPPPAPEVGRDNLGTVADVRSLDPSSRWHVDSTSSDLATTQPPETQPPDACLSSVPDASTTAHYWVRQFSTGKRSAPGDNAPATEVTAAPALQTLEVAMTPQDAQASYAASLASFGACPAPGYQVLAVKKLAGVGDVASVVQLADVDESGLRNEQVALSRSGSVVTTWIVRAPHTDQLRSRPLVRLLAGSVREVCELGGGACPDRPFTATPVIPPPDEAAPGFLSTVDLPVFEGVPAPWVATSPQATTTNPSATSCDRADFTGSGATEVLSRSFVIPGSTTLPSSFGMTETSGTFASGQGAGNFLDAVAAAVASCADRDLTLTVRETTEIDPDHGRGYVWQIDLQTSDDTTVVFRVALIKVGSMVAEVTFTPSGDADVGQSGYLPVASRAADRLTQL